MLTQTFHQINLEFSHLVAFSPSGLATQLTSTQNSS
jgi:hypothetical protein